MTERQSSTKGSDFHNIKAIYIDTHLGAVSGFLFLNIGFEEKLTLSEQSGISLSNNRRFF